jgi:hypothetical protein
MVKNRQHQKKEADVKAQAQLKKLDRATKKQVDLLAS